MKKKLLFLSLISILSLASCSKDKKEFSKGVIENKVYKSEFLGLQFSLPTNYKFLSQTEIQKLINDAATVYDNDSFMNAKNASLIDFYATCSDNSSINLTIEKSSRRLKVDTTIELFKNQANSAYSSIGLTCSFTDPIDYTLGENYSCKKMIVSFSSLTMKQYVYISKVGSYICSIACTDANGNNESTYEKCFTDYVVEETE